MNSWQKRWFRLKNWEFWPFSVFYFPVYFYYTWLALKSRSFFFFTSANPKIDFGGMLGEKKSEIFDQLPSSYIPKTHLVKAGDSLSALGVAMKIGFPIIAKPDIGERGRLVEKILDQESLQNYVNRCPVDFLIQELVHYPIELGVFFVKLPNDDKGRITSIVEKKFMSVIGDGQSDVEYLLRQNPRAQLQIDFTNKRFDAILKTVPPIGEKVIIEPIGNHNRGTIFLDRTSKADEKLEQAFNTLVDRIPEFYFGRFDLLCQSFEELRELKKFKIVELNGTGAEPGHIYQPGFSLWHGYKVVLEHFRLLYLVSKQNKKRGFAHWSFDRGMAKLKAIKEYNKLIDPVL